MSTTEQYYFGQGRCFSKQLNGTGDAAKWRWWGNVSALQLAAETEAITKRESYSGSRGTVRNIVLPTALNLTGTIDQFDTKQLAMEIYGTATSEEAGTVTGEALPADLVVGDIVLLDHTGVSSLVITDSAGTPATFPAASYELAADFGQLEILAAPTGLTEPLKAAYSYAGADQVAFLNAAQPIIAFRYQGVNLAENSAPVVVEVYKLSVGVLAQLALIQDGTDLAGRDFTCSALLDSSKSPTGTLGQFGRLIQAKPAATV